MRVFPGQEAGMYVGYGEKRLFLADTSPSEARAVSQLVLANASDLDPRFPGMTAHYAKTRTARQSIKATLNSETVAGVSLYRAPARECQLIGRASIMFGPVADNSKIAIQEGFNVVLWLDEKARNQQFGRRACQALVRAVQYNLASKTPFTLVDSDNEPSHRMVQAASFVPVGEVQDWEFAGTTYTESQLYIAN